MDKWVFCYDTRESEKYQKLGTEMHLIIYETTFNIDLDRHTIHEFTTSRKSFGGLAKCGETTPVPVNSLRPSDT